MVENSYICRLINDNPDTWRDICREKKIKVKDEGSLSIFNYNVLADFSDPYVQEARGIIIDTDGCEVKAWPFRKFGNSHESYADDIDWKHAKVTEKIDGSIVKLWHSDDGWVVSSNSCIYASEAVLSCGKSIMDLVISAVNDDALQEAIDNRVLNENRTYIFELVSPYNQIVVKYPETKLYLIGIRDNRTGREVPIFENDGMVYGDGITPVLKGIDVPKTYPVHTLDDCLEAARQLNKEGYPDQEGFVVVDNRFHRIKVKSPEYLVYHHAINNGQITKERVFDIVNSDDFNKDKLNEFVEGLPFIAKDAFVYYLDAFKDASEKAKEFIEKVRDMDRKGLSRKDIAFAIKGEPYAGFGFAGLDNKDLSAYDIVNANAKKLLKTIDDYEIGERLPELSGVEETESYFDMEECDL